MPYKSKAQARWAHTKLGMKKLGGARNVAEWDEKTDFSELPENKYKDADQHIPRID